MNEVGESEDLRVLSNCCFFSWGDCVGGGVGVKGSEICVVT